MAHKMPFFICSTYFQGSFQKPLARKNHLQKAILLPLAPEYVGYEHIQVDGNRFWQ